MNKGSNIIWVFLGVIIIGALLWFGLNSKSEEESTEYANWSYSNAFDPYDQNPYGTYVLRELMDTGFVNVKLKLIKSHLDIKKLEDAENAIYFFVGDQNYMDDKQVDYLLQFVKNGSNAFLSFHHIPPNIEFAVFDEGMERSSTLVTSRSANLKIDGFQAHQIPFIWENDTVGNDWNYFDKTEFFSLFDEIGSVENKTDFIKVKYGKGSFYFHLNPYVFTNVNMLEEEGLIYVEELFSKIPEGEVYWDIYSTTFNPENYDEKRSVIEFILKNKSLRWAFLCLLIGVLVFGFFAAKRHFTAIPIIKPNENTSLEFVETISRLYRSQGENSDLIKIKMENFRNFVSHHYFIAFKDFNGEFIFKLSQKTNIEEKTLEKLVKKLEFGAKSKDMSNDYLIQTHKMLEEFYMSCTGGKKNQIVITSYKNLELKLMRKGTLPLSIMGGGLLSIFFGLIFLSFGTGLGVIFILIGLVAAILGYLLFSSPIIKIENGKLTYRQLATELSFELQKLEASEYNKEQNTFTLNSSNSTLIILLKDLSLKDQDKLINGIRNLKI